MRIACLQFAPRVGDVDNNLNRADAILHRANPRDLDLLVLPELAFSGYNFKSLKHITPYLEPTAAGISSLWARTAALKYDCTVTVGYPEKVDITEKWPASPEYYNSAITVNADGQIIANYRKTFLYYCDETWALEGPEGFFDGEIEGLGNVVMGICMDLNPYKFEAQWNDWEFAHHILHKQANLVILSMAWLTREDVGFYSSNSQEPDMETLSYWLARLEPVIRAEDIGEVIVVLANRCGVEDEAIYAGTSCVLGIENGEVKLYGILGRGEKELLVVDTSEKPQAKLVVEQDHIISDIVEETRRAPKRRSRDPVLDGLTLSIDTVLSEAMPISPVEPRAPHAYFGAERPAAGDVLSGLKSSVGLNHSSNSPHTIPNPLPFSNSDGNQSSSPRLRNSSRTRLLEHPVTPDKQMKGLKITPVDSLGLDEAERSESNSASSMRVNTPWEKSPSVFRAEDITAIVKAASPAPKSRSPLPKKGGSALNSVTRAAGSPAADTSASSARVSSRGPKMPPADVIERTISPKTRRSSRSRQREQQPALPVNRLTHDPPAAPIVLPGVPPPSRTSGREKEPSITNPDRGLAIPDELGSPRPRSTVW